MMRVTLNSPGGSGTMPVPLAVSGLNLISSTGSRRITDHLPPQATLLPIPADYVGWPVCSPFVSQY
jgi:hypothetical protein